MTCADGRCQLFEVDCEQKVYSAWLEQDLRWMLSWSISSIDDWDRCCCSSSFGRASQVMSKYYAVSITFNCPDGVCIVIERKVCSGWRCNNGSVAAASSSF